jgi:hypothetical protein
MGGIFRAVGRNPHEAEAAMIDREKVETILLRRFPGVSIDQIAAAVNAIMALDDTPREAGSGCCGHCGDHETHVASALPSRAT